MALWLGSKGHQHIGAAQRHKAAEGEGGDPQLDPHLGE